VSTAKGSYMQPESAKWFACWVWRLGAASLRRVLAGLCRADGDSTKSRCIWTSSARFRDEIQRVCLMAGYTAHFRCASKVRGAGWAVSFAEPDGSPAGEKACKPNLFKARGEIRERQYTGRVWCFTMPSGFIWVRRVAKDEHGVVTKASRPLITGNCKPHYHERFSPLCGGCGERITSGGYASALGQSWHPDHLVCAQCRQPFKSGRFIAKGNKPFCDKDCHGKYVAAHGSMAASAAPALAPSAASKGKPGSSPSLSRGPGSSSTVERVAKRSSGLQLAPLTSSASASALTSLASPSGSETASFSEHLNRFAFFKKFYLEICTEAAALPDAAFVSYVDSCVALRRKVSVLRLSGDVCAAQAWSAPALLLVARAVVRASTFGAPQGVNFSENMAITTIDLSGAGLGTEHVEALTVLLGCSFPLRELLLAANAGLGKKALVEITEALCRRKSLQRIDLRACGVGDKPVQHLLVELARVKTDFVALDLSDNALTAAAGQFVGEFVSSNAALQELRLSDNKLGDKGVVDLVKHLQLPQHTALRVLALAGTGLKRGVELAQWINANAKHRSALADCLFLSELDVSNNALDADFAVFAGQLIATPACPSTLNLATNKFNAKATKMLIDGLVSAKCAARDLSLGGSDIGDAAMTVLCDALRPGGAVPTPPLVRLSLRNCSISAAGFGLLAKALKAGGKLVELDVAFNKIPADSATELAAAIVNGNVMDELNVAACHLSKASLVPFCKLVRHSATLTKLHLDANEWSSAALQELATALEFNQRLELLTLRNINVSSKEAIDFVMSLSDSITLRKLNLEQNGIEKPPASFTDRLAKFKHLTVLWR
jgi:Ran GTPase-activating protein (RanGAP) involved in mRNA processing and transport